MEELLKTYGLPGIALGVMAWLVKLVMADAKTDRDACTKERQAFLTSLAEHSIRDADALAALKETLADLKLAIERIAGRPPAE